ncbi:MAG: 23S rRNA (uracil(1939)-C(5))-methyltransferase RlmD, partial [Candidatus Binatia bacterium]
MAEQRKFPRKAQNDQKRFSRSGPPKPKNRDYLEGRPARPFGRNLLISSREHSGSEAREQQHPCPHFPACYGCPFAQFPYLQQLDKKRALVSAELLRYETLQTLAVPPLFSSPRQFGYRTRVKLVVRRVGGKPVIGLYIPETHKVTDASSCAVHPRPVNSIVEFLKEAIERLDIPLYDEEHDTGLLRYLDIRYSLWSHQALLTLVTRHMHFPQVRELIRELERRFPFLCGIVQNIHDKPGNAIWGDRFYPLRGRDALVEKFGPLRLTIPVNAFAQANPPVAQKLYNLVLSWAQLGGEEIALDLYCGIGPIALHLAGRAKLVVGIDDNPGAVNVAKENARRNGYNNTRFFTGDAAEKLKETTANIARFDISVVNPPRKGLSPEAFASLLVTRAPRLIYVSCEPTTLARDLDRFVQAGYNVHQIQSFDMFPQTDQVETVALLALHPMQEAPAA